VSANLALLAAARSLDPHAGPEADAEETVARALAGM